MKALLKELLDNLDSQHASYEQLIAAAGDEKTALCSRNPDRILDIVRLKEALLLRLRSLEEQRRLICLRLARQLEVPAGELCITHIRELLGECQGYEHETGALADMQRRLRDATTQLAAINERLRNSCQSGLETVEALAREISRQTPHATNPAYGAPGRGTPYGGEKRSSINLRT